MLNWPSRELHRECPQPHTAYQDRISKNQISRTRFAEEPRPLNGVLERLFSLRASPRHPSAKQSSAAGMQGLSSGVTGGHIGRFE